MFKNQKAFIRKPANVGVPTGPDPLTVALDEVTQLRARIKELEADPVKAVEKPKKKAAKKKAAKKVTTEDFINEVEDNIKGAK